MLLGLGAGGLGLASIAPQRHRKVVLLAEFVADAGPQSHLRGIERRVAALEPRALRGGLNRTSEASKGYERGRDAVRRAASIAPQRHRKIVVAPASAAVPTASIAPQRHRKPAPRRSDEHRAEPQSHLRGIERRQEELGAVPPPRGLNRTSEASKVGADGDTGRAASVPQSHLRGIESPDNGREPIVFEGASIAPQRHRK